MLALTHSPAKAGIVSFARLIPSALFALPAGIASDRWNRKRLMIAADGVRALAIASLVTTILLHRAAYWQIPLVAFVEGSGLVVFSACSIGALRAVVPPRQLPTAIGAQRARVSIVLLAGPPLGGALFGIARVLPFLTDFVSYAASILTLRAMRTPFQQTREVDRSPLRVQVAEGFHFLWGQPFLRTAAFIYGGGNFAIPAVLFVVLVLGKRHGLSGGEIGALLAAFAVCTLIGSLASPLFRRAFSVRTILLQELWAWLGTIAFLVHPNVYVLLVCILPLAVTLPITDSVVEGYRVAITPERMLGRVESVRSNISLLLAPLGPLAAGFLLESLSARSTVALFTAWMLSLAVFGTLSPAIRNAPSLDELADLP